MRYGFTDIKQNSKTLLTDAWVYGKVFYLCLRFVDHLNFNTMKKLFLSLTSLVSVALGVGTFNNPIENPTDPNEFIPGLVLMALNNYTSTQLSGWPITTGNFGVIGVVIKYNNGVPRSGFRIFIDIQHLNQIVIRNYWGGSWDTWKTFTTT